MYLTKGKRRKGTSGSIGLACIKMLIRKLDSQPGNQTAGNRSAYQLYHLCNYNKEEKKMSSAEKGTFYCRRTWQATVDSSRQRSSMLSNIELLFVKFVSYLLFSLAKFYNLIKANQTKNFPHPNNSILR